MMNLKRKSKGLMKTLGLVTMLALSVAVTGCSDDDDNPMTPMGEGAELRVVHASPDAGNVDIYAEGVAAPLLTNVPYTATRLSITAGNDFPSATFTSTQSLNRGNLP